MPTLAEKQEEMRRRAAQQRQALATKENYLLTPTQPGEEERRVCISCKRRVARVGTVFCSRCTAKGLQNNLRDTLPGLPVSPKEGNDGSRSSINCTASTRSNTDRNIDRNENKDKELIIHDTGRLGNCLDKEYSEARFEEMHQEAPELDKQKTYTRAEVAKMLGVSATTLCRWESKGRIPQPKRIVHSNQCVYTEEIIAAAREYMRQEYVPPTPSITTSNTPTGRLPFAMKKTSKVNRRLERVVAINLGSGKGML